MKHCKNSFPQRKSLVSLTFLAAMLTLAALDANAQKRPDAETYQKASLKTAKPCTVAPAGEVTALVKNGVELSVTEDWDCDGVPDAYDNCVGMPNPSQTDGDRNGIGDACEAAATVTMGVPVKDRLNVKAESRKAMVRVKGRSNAKARIAKATAVDRRSLPNARRRRSR